MIPNEWMRTVKENQDRLLRLIHDYHPASAAYRHATAPMPITAPGAEQACETVRQEIRQEEIDRSESPETRFLKAILSHDIHAVYSLLSAAWFGVPESTECWRIPGFGVAVDLLDDPPDTPDTPDSGGES